MAEIVECFFQLNPKSLNSELNKQRETVISNLINCPKKFLNSPEFGDKWKKLKENFENYLNLYFPKIDISDITIKQKGGRSNNYDFDLVSKNLSYKLEFKYNSKCLDGIPEFLNLSEKNNIMIQESFYSNYFYDNYLSSIIELSGYNDIIPEKTTYFKLVYQSKYSKHPLFKWLKEQETNEEFYNKKSEIVRNSISNYLEKNKENINFKKLEEEFERTQNNKHYLLWYENKFYYDYINPNQLKLTGEVSIKNNNTYVLKTKCNKTEIHMLLRWKNHLGVLFPAYQIKLVRNIIGK